MSDNILVIEYEPKYTDRVRQALTGQPLPVSFARDGEEALRAVAVSVPRLVVLSTVLPKGNASDIIRAIRAQSPTVPILLTMSGYSGTDPAQDALRFGVTAILPKPYSETEFLSKIKPMLGLTEESQLTSSDIFGDILEDKSPANAPPRKTMNPKNDIDKMLADTLGSNMPRKSTTSPGTLPKPKSAEDVDKIIQDTLSGLEKRRQARSGTDPGIPVPPPDRVPVSQPLLEPAPPAPPPAAPVAAPSLAAKEEPDPTDGIRFGPYVLLEKIATGGMAEVWKARKSGEEGFQKIVAIKKILPHLSDNQEFIEMFIDEAKLAAQLTHNNIIHIYDLGKIQSSYYIAMEFVDGDDLKTILKRGQDRGTPMGVELALFIASRLAAALDYAHRKRDLNQKEMDLVHRDVSPQNVLISQDGDVKLCDFGIAKAASKASHTHSGALKGKLQYMSPEQASGKSIDRRSDIFAVAAVLFEMLAGRKLFSGDSEMSILEQVREARVTAPSAWNDEVSSEIDAIVARGLQKDPAMRYQTAGEMAKDIEAVLYALRPTPTSADLAIYMHRLSAPEAAPPPAPEPPPPVVEPPKPTPPPARTTTRPVRAIPAAAQASGTSMPAWEAPPVLAAQAKKRSPVVPAVIAAVLVGGVAGGFFFLRGRPASDAAAAPVAVNTAAAAAPLATALPAETGTLVPANDTTATSVAAPGGGTIAVATNLDPALVDQEVQRLLAAERARMEREALAAQQRQQQTATTAPVRPAPQPVTQTAAPQPVATQTVDLPPLENTAAPVPTATTATTAEVRPQPPTDTAPPAPRYREGDLVPQGTDGLTPARVIRFGTVSYPPMARAQRVQGTIIMNVLVSEKGEVLEIRMIRGVNRPVGLNEAAEQVVRRSTFAAPMLRDGTRVKSWATVPVKFEL